MHNRCKLNPCCGDQVNCTGPRDTSADMSPTELIKMSDIAKLMLELREGLTHVTPGPWQVVEEQHPWLLSPKPEWDRPEEKRGHHTERRIFTVAHHPQLKAPWPVVNQASGIGVGKPVQFVVIEAKDAAHIARCSPDNIRTILAHIASQDRRIEEMRRALLFARGAINDNEHFTDTAEVLDAALKEPTDAE